MNNFIKKCIHLSMMLLLGNVSVYAANNGKIGKVTGQKAGSVSIDGQPSLADIIGQVARDRKELHDLRERLIQEYNQQGMKGNCMHIAGKVTYAIIDYLNKRIDETIKKVGKAPVPFSVFTMGSMARDESGFFTDLEIGILVPKKDTAVLNYFKRFSQVLVDRFYVLGEHPDVGGKGMRIDEGNNAPNHLSWYARYASSEQLAELEKEGIEAHEGSRLFVATPQEFAALLDPHLSQKLAAMPNVTAKEKEIAEGVSAIARNVRYLYGDKKVFDQYMTVREKYLKGGTLYNNPMYTNRREEIAYFNLEYDFKKHAGPEITTGRLGDIVAPKLTLYRFPEQVLTGLGFWYNVGVQNTVQIADRLVAIKRMSPEWGEALKDLMNFTVCLRLKKQIKLGKQIFDVPVTQKGYMQLKQKFTNALVSATKDLNAAKVQKDNAAIMDAEEDILKAQVGLRDLEKMAPGKPDPILSGETINLLNTKYLPIEKKLYETLRSFLAGDKNAFLSTDVSAPVQPAPTPKPTPVTPKSPGSNKGIDLLKRKK